MRRGLAMCPAPIQAPVFVDVLTVPLPESLGNPSGKPFFEGCVPLRARVAPSHVGAVEDDRADFCPYALGHRRGLHHEIDCHIRYDRKARAAASLCARSAWCIGGARRWRSRQRPESGAADSDSLCCIEGFYGQRCCMDDGAPFAEISAYASTLSGPMMF